MPNPSAPRADTTQPASPARAGSKCTRCDAVCCRLTVVLQPEDNIPAHLTAQLPNGLQVMAHAEDGWCVAMDRTHMNCGIYANRPSVCRRFVMGGAYCNAIRSDYTRQHPRSIAITLK
ncbi:YkgJ family cysteine cluster protein [Dyella psychrodurans]|uniref:YkgJ family cysteine cluster protein n=1 Tax=Dyella psychrodurans TaxID=1927960 RepID=A0A370X6Z8_9GAMM|nr:YkgJ family cysteine cluster protein [Dyella psychrodurans]RDS84203.1 YkgJ family cysteine cluster protein [Dyella psychrodurans]